MLIYRNTNVKIDHMCAVFNIITTDNASMFFSRKMINFARDLRGCKMAKEPVS